MELTVTSYPNARLIEPGEPERAECGTVYLYPCPDEEFADRMDGKEAGLYQYNVDEVFRFYVPYATYTVWRDLLARLVHCMPARIIWDAKEEFKGKEFVELIDFTDCDGTIGPTTAFKLASNFYVFADEAKELAKQMDESRVAGDIKRGSMWFEIYEKFLKAFRIAADGGFVKFG